MYRRTSDVSWLLWKTAKHLSQLQRKVLTSLPSRYILFPRHCTAFPTSFSVCKSFPLGLHRQNAISSTPIPVRGQRPLCADTHAESLRACTSTESTLCSGFHAGGTIYCKTLNGSGLWCALTDFLVRLVLNVQYASM